MEGCRLDDGYVAVPIHEGDGTLRLCAVVAMRDSRPTLIDLRHALAARVVLGCVCDAADVVHRWLEIWIQDADALRHAPMTVATGHGDGALDNAALDHRWRQHADALSALDDSVIHGDWAHEHPLPTWLNVAGHQPVHPRHEASQSPWRLCRDDALLGAAVLPAYSTTRHRYLYVPDNTSDNARFIPITAGAPANDATGSLESLGLPANLVALNPAGGLMLVRAHSPIALESLLDLLAGKSWEGPSPVVAAKPPAGVMKLLTGPPRHDAPAQGRLLLGRRGLSGRLIEAWHLKLCLIHSAIRGVEQWTARTQQPLLNLSADSFHVDLCNTGDMLPALWTAKVKLIDTGCAIPIKLQGTDQPYYMAADTAGSDTSGVYRPRASGPIQGSASVRLRELSPPGQTGITVQGTLITDQSLAVTGGNSDDLIWFALRQGDRLINLYAHLQRDQALAAGETRFITLPLKLDDHAVAFLKQAAGSTLPGVPFQMLPLLNTPCDLYSLGILAVRALLVNSQTTLALAADEMLSLARAAGDSHGTAPRKQAASAEEPSDLPARIRALLETDPRWLASLGPHHLLEDAIAPADALALLPVSLWCDTLAAIVRMFPDVGPDSAAASLGSAAPGAPGGVHKVFHVALDDFTRIIRRSRAMILGDFQHNQEIQTIITQSPG